MREYNRTDITRVLGTETLRVDNRVTTILKTYKIDCLEEDKLQEEAIDDGITEKMRDSLDAAVMSVAVASLTQEDSVRLAIDRDNYEVGELMEAVIAKYLDTSAERQDELRQIASKIQMRRNRSAVEYVNKHRILRQDIINAGCKEILTDADEQVTVRYIINGLRDDPDWAPFRSSYKMVRKTKEPQTIDELEEDMIEDERERKSEKSQTSSQTTRWNFPNQERATSNTVYDGR